MSYELDLEKDGVSYVPNVDMMSRRRGQVPVLLRGGKIPPQAIEMEQAVIGGLLSEKDAMDKVVAIISGEKFFKEGHKLIFDSCTALYAASQPIDLLTVKNHLAGVGMLEAVGGIQYLMELSMKVASSANIEYHARVIHQKWVSRTMIRLCSDTIDKAFDETSDPFEVHSSLLKDLEEIEPKSDELVNGSDLIPEIAKDVEAAMRGESPSIKLGFRDMDKEYAFDFGEYVVVAGDSGTGKTTFIMQAAKRIRKEYKDVPILFNARDMDGKKVVARDLASEMGMSQMRFRTGNGMEKHHFGDMNELACAYDGIYFCSEFTSAALRSHIRKLKKKLGLNQDAGMIVINDYLQLGDADGGSREQVVGNISLDDKKIAKRNNALVIDLSQVNESAGKLRPNHKSIRESRAPYHHADWVIFLYSPSKNGEERYEDGSSTAGIIEAILDKVRCGRPGNIIKLQMTMHGLITDISDGSTDYEQSLNLPPIQPNMKYLDRTSPKHSDEQQGGGGDFFPF